MPLTGIGARVVASGLALVLVTSLSHATIYKVEYDQQTRELSITRIDAGTGCGTSKPAGPSIGPGAGVLRFRRGDILQISVLNSMPGLLKAEVKPSVVEVSESVSHEELSGVMKGWPGTPPDRGASQESTLALRENQQNANPGTAYKAVLDDLSALNRTVNENPADADRALGALRTAKNRLDLALGGAMIERRARLVAVLQGTSLPVPDEHFFDRLDDLVARSGAVGSLEGAVFDMEDDVNYTIEFTSRNELIAPPSSRPVLFARHGRWEHCTTTGIGFSALFDEEYSTATTTVGSTAVRSAVLEKHDWATPEALYLLHVYPQGGSIALTLGGGLSADATGRIYLGLSGMLGHAGALTAGAAIGKVKRLSSSVHPGDLGDIDPNTATRQVREVKFMAALTFRVSQ